MNGWIERADCYLHFQGSHLDAIASIRLKWNIKDPPSRRTRKRYTMTFIEIFLSHSGKDSFEASLLQFAIEQLLADLRVKVWTAPDLLSSAHHPFRRCGGAKSEICA